MAFGGSVFLSMLLSLAAAACFSVGTSDAYYIPFNRSSFPTGFLFGAGSAAYQSEGAAFLDGRGPSIWDTFVRKHPEKIWDHSTGDVADDFYHRYKEDIKLMKKIGLDSFRFSISWPRLLPKGKLSGGVNQLGVKFYNNLINELVSNGIKPLVTLLHYDPPQALDDLYGGFLSPNIINDYGDYVNLCFKTFGDRVKHWVTMNEPNGFAINAYDGGTFAPGRCSNYEGNCTSGNSATEPYIVAHHLLLAHSAAVKIYKDKYQASQKGQIGITIVTHWWKPKFPEQLASRKATLRSLDFMFGWFADPIFHGDYPKVMRSLVGNRLPKFTEAESKQIKGSLDFLGFNYYTTYYTVDEPASSNSVNHSWSVDRQIAASTTDRNGALIGAATDLDWLFVYPKGIREVLVYIKEKYNNPDIYITENGYAYGYNASMPIQEARKDNLRIRYHHDHLWYLLKAIKDGVKVKGYYAWSFWDDFEWDAGYTVGFGLTLVDVKDNLRRYLKYSAYWFKMFLLH
ncbi:putative glycosidase [Rosa chinensis]|uniref:Putative glycosidase n=1 Tax=Rosa chinensis TaxID=74649 RepID=A0A2P6S747_ROSCH|nr:vicianin hydrolase [Rosa chinensis]PRQ54454.1 putative glycosidase [Rosa chinensis]